jgi:hypothetical protein
VAAAHLAGGVLDQEPELHRTRLLLVLCAGTLLQFSFICKDLIAF